MAVKELRQILQAVPDLLNIPYEHLWSTYDKEADVLYLNFRKPSHADDCELTDDDIIIRYEKSKVIGITILHASKRAKK